MSKKIMALVLALAMVFSTITVAFAEEPVAEAVAEEVAEVAEVSAEAKALGTIGMLEGAGDGLTAEYTATELNRLTAAIMILKLKGLYEDALKYDGVNNFVDAEELKWEDGKKVLAYLKDNPTVGFGGNEKGEFNPNGTLSEQMLYKVLLENLGYKQVTADVADGDFAWEETLEFAEKLGLKPAKAEKFTVDGLSKAVVAALKTNIKDGKAWIEVLVESGKVDEGKAIAADLMAEAPAVTAALKSAKAIGNTVVEVEFDAEINEGATDIALYAIEGLEVKAAMLDGTKKVLLETAAQTAGKKYTLVVGEVKVNFGGMAKVTGTPELKKVTGPDTERVKLEFDKVLDTASALDIANYSISDVTIVSGELDSARKVVTLTTEGLKAGKTHTIKVTNVKSVDGFALKSASKNFYSKSDKLVPKIEKVEAKTNTRVLLTFNKLVTKESAEDLANYVIKAGSNELAIEKLEATDNDDDKTEVEITTASQKSGTRYELSVVNIVDQSVLGNTLAKASKATFSGKAEDKTAPTLKGFDYQARNKIVVNFNEASRLDKDSVLDASNYTINNDIDVEKVEILPGEDEKDFKSVLLTVSELGGKNSYELKIVGIKDEYDNEMKEKKSTKSYNKTNAIATAKIKKVEATKENELKIYFDKYLDGATAKDVANYSINKDIGTPVKAAYKAETMVVTLTTGSDLTAGTEYTLTVNGVVDLGGNVLNFKPKFVGLTVENDKEAPEVDYIEAVNSEVVKITFTEKIHDAEGNAKITVNGKELVAKITYDDGKSVEFSSAIYNYPTASLGLDDKEYTISNPVNIADKAGNKFVVDKDNNSFYGTSEKPELLEMTWEQVNVKKFKLVFSEKIANPTGKSFEGLSASRDKDDYTIGYLTAGSPIKIDKKFTGDLGKVFTNAHGVPVANDDADKKLTELVADYEDTDAPYIEKVEATDRKTIVITYNEDLSETYYGKYEVTYYDEKDNLKKLSLASAKGELDANEVTLTVTGVLDSKYTYTLKVTEVARDLAGNKAEAEEFSFEGSDLVPVENYITGVDVFNGTKFNVKLFAAVDQNEQATLKQGTLAIDAANITTTAKSISDGKSKTFEVVLNGVLLQSGKEYEVELAGYTFKFKGIVEEGLNVTVDENNKVVISYADANEDDEVKLTYGKFEATGNTFTSVTLAKSTDYKDGEWSKQLDAGQKLCNAVVRRGSVVFYTFEHEDNNKEAANVVIELIKAAVAGENPDPVKTAKAREEYDELSLAQRDLVSNYADLVTAEEKIAAAAVKKINEGTADEADYTTAGVVGVTAENLDDVKAAVAAAKVEKESDLTVDEIQAEVDKVLLIAAKAELNTNIDSAQSLHDGATEGAEPGNYAVGSKAILKTAIDDAQAVYGDAEATLEEVETAITDLADAVAEFEAGKVE